VTRAAFLVTISLAVAMVLGCSRSGAPAEPQFRMSAVQFVDEFLADRPAAAERYGGKILELSGTVGNKHGTAMSALGIGFQEIDPAKAFESNMPLFFFEPTDSRAREEYESIAVGDAVRIRCLFEIMDLEKELYLVKECRLVR